MRLCEFAAQIHTAIGAIEPTDRVQVFVHLLTGTPYWAYERAGLAAQFRASKLHLMAGTYTRASTPRCIHADLLQAIEDAACRMDELPEVTHHGVSLEEVLA